MQVDRSIATTSSPLSSLVSSSIPSIDPAPTVSGARAKVTYSRKPLATEHDGDDPTRVGTEPSSSSPPADNLFDSPMRLYGRNAASRIEQDANDVTITADVSPATTAHAANSAVKIGPSSLFRRVDSQPSQHSDNDDDEPPQGSTESPAVHRTNNFNLGISRAIFDSDSDSDAEAPRSEPAAQHSTGNNDQDRDEEEDDVIIARIRAHAARDTDSDPFTGSLSSVPISSSQPHSSSHRVSSGDKQRAAEDDQDGSITLTRRRGARISAMKGRTGNQKQSEFSSSSDQDTDDDDDDHVQARKARAFKLASPASSASVTPADQADAQAGPSVTIATTPQSRREKMDALAARFRKAHGEQEAVVETSAQADPLLDAFFGGRSPGRIPSRSPSLDIQGSDDDEHNDAMPAFMVSNFESAATAKPKSKSKKKKNISAATERDILSDLEDDFDRTNAKVASKRAATAAKEKALPKVKPLSKKDLETMHRQTARLARENRTRLAPIHQKKTIGLNELLSKIQASEAGRSTTSHTASSNTSADNASDGSGQPSSQIPSGQSKSQHASDPIESDPIPERSSPHPNNLSSPVVPMSRQQERRLGLDPSTSHANFLQTTPAAGRVAGLATKQDHASQAHQKLLAQASEQDDDAELPDLASIVQQSRAQQEADKEAAQRLQRLRDMKIRLLEKSRQQPSSVVSKKIESVAQNVDADDEGLELYQPGSVLAAKHNLPATPGKKRPTDLLYREIGVRPGKTPPSRKLYTGTNANGSPNTALHIGEDEVNADAQDDLVVTDSQLRSAGKGLFIASDQAAGHVSSAEPPQPNSAQTRQDESAHHCSALQGAGRAGPPKMTQAQLNATLMRKMQTQSVKARSQASAKNARAKVSPGTSVDKYGRSAAPDVNTMLQQLGQATSSEGQARHDDHQDEDEDDPDYIMPPARDAESVIGSDVDMGSASEIEPVDENEDFVEMGSADEDDETHDIDQAVVRDTIQDADEEHDSEKENAPPPASQQPQLSNPSPSLSRSLLPSRAVMDDDEDEMPAARLNARRARRSAVADDDDGDDEADQIPLQPGPFDGSRSNAPTEGASQSQERVRIPLGDISSQSIDQSMPFSPSQPSSAAFHHSRSPSLAASAAGRRDPLVIPLSAGQDEYDSFRTDDIPSQAADLGRFFEPTMPPPSMVKSAVAASQVPKSFWDQTQTQTQTQTQSQDPSQLPSSSRPPQATEAIRSLVRDASANSALGAFFQDTQQDELRGESLDIFDNHKVAGGKAPGFTQFFHDGTPPPSADARGLKAGPSVWDASTMPPPKSTEVDAFAALRKAQMGEAMDFLDATPSVLPSFDESQAEREAYAQAQANGPMANRSPEKMYMNRDGFFTQTKPSQQTGLWSQYDSQSQSQSQHNSAGGAGAAWQSPAARHASARRGSDISNASGDHNAPLSEEEEDEMVPVQLKRLRRGAAATEHQQDNEDPHDDANSEIDDENGPPSSQPEPKPRNAFDVLRRGPIQPADDEEPVITGKKRKSAFIEGEAEESEDEELGGQKRGDGGGLKGIFGDDDGSASGGDEDDDEDDANAEDLQELVDNERELDEAEKDEVARARFREDMDAKDREELEIHQKAIQGGYRNRRRGAGLNGIEGFLDDDAEDEELKRRAAMGSHAALSAWKKRKLLDGTEDGMDALAAHEEAQAFVNSYAATHRIDHESEKYDFLAMAAEDQEDDEDNESGDEEMDEADAADQGGDAEGEDVEEDAFGPVPKQPRTIRYNDIASIIRERKKAKRRSALDDDDDDDNDELNAGSRENQWDSDEDDTEARLATAMHDRIRGNSTQKMPTVSSQPKRKPQISAQYGRNARTAAASHLDGDAMDIDTPEQEEADDADDDTSSSLMARLLSNRPTARPSGLRSGSSMAVDTLEDAEPEWGNDANIVRAPKPAASGTGAGSQQSTGSSKFKVASSPFRAAGARKGGKGKVGGSMLLSKQAIMRRESGFSSSSSGSR